MSFRSRLCGGGVGMGVNPTPPLSRCSTRPPSPLDSTFSVVAGALDPDSIVTQITLINGEKIWVREEVNSK